MAFMTGSDVKLLDPLKDPLSKINKKSQSSLQDALNQIGARQTASANASGRVQGQYAPAELARAGNQASLGIEDALAGAYGGASYDELKKQQEHEQNLALAREIGDLTAPSVLEQVLSGLGGGVRTGGQAYALYNQLGNQGGYSNRTPVDFGFSNPSTFGLNYPDPRKLRGYDEEPSMLRVR